MFSRIALLITVFAFLGTTGIGLSQKTSDPKLLIKKIVSAWEGRRKQIKNLSASAAVESFYPKGFLSEQLRRKNPEAAKKLLPAEDKTFTDNSCSWTIDFAKKRVRKECRLVGEVFYQSTGKLVTSFALHLFADGKYTMFCPKEQYPADLRNAGLVPDVVLYKGASHDFLFSIQDLPILWLGGGVNGKWPNPRRLQFLESADKFTYHGKAKWKNRDCVILTVQEQNSSTSVREFWVGTEEPYPIYYCCARGGDVVNWQFEVDYQQKDGQLIPVQWTSTGYLNPSKLFTRRTFSLKEINFNRPLSAEIFQKKLKPGSVVIDAVNDKNLEVDSTGRLVPLGAGGSRFRVWIVIAVLVAVVLAGFFAWRLVRRRWSQSIAAASESGSTT